MINQKRKSEKSLKSDYFGRGAAPVSEGGGHEHKQHGSCGADYLLTAATATGRGQSENRNINGFILRDGNGNCSLDSRRVQNITGSWC